MVRKVMAGLFYAYFQILTDYQNSFTAGKSKKLATNHHTSWEVLQISFMCSTKDAT